MLTQEEQDYIDRIDPHKRVHVFPFQPKLKKLGESIVAKIKSALPDARVVFMGSAVLEIAGQRDIDIYILEKQENFSIYLPKLIKIFGEPAKKGKYVRKTFIEWKYNLDNIEVEIYLTEIPDRQIKVFELLKSNADFLKEYESLKLQFNGKKYKEYQKAKYEFYNKILSDASHIE